MTAEHVETLIIGGGQAGLATAYHLGRLGRSSVVVDALDRVGDNWRRHYDSLTLFSPRKVDGLPGLDFPGPAMGLPTKDEVADYLEAYADHHGIPVRCGVKVERVRRNASGFEANTTDGTFHADNVVVAAGKVDHPHVPDFADQLDPHIVQLHSSEYRRPSQLAPGPALVVGAAHSGADVALELAATRPTILAGHRTGQMPFRLDGPFIRFAAPVARFATTKIVSLGTPIGRKVKGKIRAGGGPLIDPRVEDLEEAGVEWIEERTAGVQDGRPMLANGQVLDVANVVWCTGFHHDLSWIELDIVGEDGWPLEDRGVVPSEPGLYFMGLVFQSSFASMLLHGVGRDARHVANHIARRVAAAV